ncbi:MAG: TraR/DksA family transcriptional regulator [Cognatishimia activa]|uniref:TraR/DksA C4-type zinc finger protein n=1 Tax=Cognatishimia activa TaxID=1715691 RepID=A0A975I807_9RHOB|nr:TraR/DksA C4-type zinc finger protein [Cognatishimia activa]QTN35396.1 TraR/DksA C4-type zinc finger protein [Cognatishimia activa]
MNASAEAEIREIILQKLAELEEQDRLGRDGQAVVELDQQAVGRLSRMDALQSQAMAKATQAQREIQVKALNAALKRMEDDDYGYCQDCGEDIPDARLKLNPAVLKCMSCATG